MSVFCLVFALAINSTYVSGLNPQSKYDDQMKHSTDDDCSGCRDLKVYSTTCVLDYIIGEKVMFVIVCYRYCLSS